LKKSIPVVLMLIALGLATFIGSVHATTYTVTLTMKINGRTLWTKTCTIDVEDDTITVKVPPNLYETIIRLFGTDTFTTPFSIRLGGTSFCPITLHVESVPSGLTIAFEPAW